MLSLRDLQAAIGAHVLGARALDPDGPSLATHLREDGLRFERRLQIYRNNTYGSLTEALKDSFPVVCQLVDERFFKYAAHEYIERHPPRAPRLAEYGADFAAFLAGFEPARSLAYLPDVARLEWAINEAYQAADAPTLDPARIAAVPQERYAALAFVVHPSCRLVTSPFPVDRIWQAHQPGGDPATPIDLAAGGCRLLVDRRDGEIRFLSLDAPGRAFIEGLVAGRTLQAAYETAAAVDPTFDLVGALGTHLGRGSFTDFIDPAA